jgi:hypothetical protein
LANGFDVVWRRLESLLNQKVVVQEPIVQLAASSLKHCGDRRVPVLEKRCPAENRVKEAAGGSDALLGCVASGALDFNVEVVR